MRNWDKWHKYFLGLAEYVSTASKDPSTKVGAVLVDPETLYVVGMGYNGFPRNVHDDEERYNDRDKKYQLVVHAEENAIISAGHRANGAYLYVWPSFMVPPICSRCCASAIQAGVKMIIGYQEDENNLNERQLRWKESILLSRMMCDEAGVSYLGIDERKN